MAQGSEPETTPLIDEPFLLEFPADGRVRLVTPPSIPDEIAELTDLTREFNDFFITLPGRALTPGVEWADTMTVTGARRSSDTFQSHQVRRYRVVRDTMVGKTAAFLFEVVGEERIEGSGPMAEAPHITASTVLEGGDTGFAVFSPATGRLIARWRSGKLTGQVRLTGGPQPMELPQTFEYTHRIESVR